MKKWGRYFLVMGLVLIVMLTLINALETDFIENDHQIKWVKGYEETASRNLVTAIYLDYRLFDTFIEATILFVAVGGVIFMSKRDQDVT